MSTQIKRLIVLSGDALSGADALLSIREFKNQLKF
jgi:hypothetical protein